MRRTAENFFFPRSEENILNAAQPAAHKKFGCGAAHKKFRCREAPKKMLQRIFDRLATLVALRAGSGAQANQLGKADQNSVHRIHSIHGILQISGFRPPNGQKLIGAATFRVVRFPDPQNPVNLRFQTPKLPEINR